MIAQTLAFWVAGVPVPQGSKKAFVRGRFANIVDDNETVLKPWRKKVADAAAVANAGRDPLEGPVLVVLEFRFVRPKTVKRSTRR